MGDVARRATLVVSLGGLVLSAWTGYSTYVTVGALCAVVVATFRWLAPHRLAPGAPAAEMALLTVPLTFIYAQDVLSRGTLPLYDQYFFLADAWLGQPGFVVGRLFARWPWLALPCTAAYRVVPIVLTLAYLSTHRRRELLRALLLSGALGIVCYGLAPAAGPRFTFPAYPWHGVVDVPRPLFITGAIPNCMPSLHLTWALLAAHYSRWRLAMWALAVLTGVATLGLGEHYAIDLMAAVPFTALLVWLAGRTWTAAPAGRLVARVVTWTGGSDVEGEGWPGAWSSIRFRWAAFCADRRHVATALASFAVLAGVFTAFIPFLAFNESRHGYVFHDPVLAMYQPIAASRATLLLTHASFLSGLVVAATSPRLFVRFMQAYALMIVIRTGCMFLVPLEPPPAMINLGDPVIEALVYAGRQNTKDLFFSGHTATVALFGFVLPGPVLGPIYLCAATLVGVLLLAQHAHFSIDVLAAPVAAYASARLQERVRLPRA